MLFEVYQNGQPKMQTQHKSCIPSDEQLMRMKKAGCTFKLDGKRYIPKTPEKRSKT